MKKLLFAALFGLYRSLVAPLLVLVTGAPVLCRYAPSCSRYAEEAILRHGVLLGIAMAARRLISCRPGCPGGYNPVP